jgi:hypothetical protein
MRGFDGECESLLDRPARFLPERAGYCGQRIIDEAQSDIAKRKATFAQRSLCYSMIVAVSLSMVAVTVFVYVMLMKNVVYRPYDDIFDQYNKTLQILLQRQAYYTDLYISRTQFLAIVFRPILQNPDWSHYDCMKMSMCYYNDDIGDISIEDNDFCEVYRFYQPSPNFCRCYFSG